MKVSWVRLEPLPLATCAGGVGGLTILSPPGPVGGSLAFTGGGVVAFLLEEPEAGTGSGVNIATVMAAPPKRIDPLNCCDRNPGHTIVNPHESDLSLLSFFGKSLNALR